MSSVVLGLIRGFGAGFCMLIQCVIMYCLICYCMVLGVVCCVLGHVWCMVVP